MAHGPEWLQKKAESCNSVETGPQAGEGDGDALDVCAAGGHTVSDVLADVVSEGAGKVGVEGSDGALSGGLCLEDEAHECNHCKAAVLDLPAAD